MVTPKTFDTTAIASLNDLGSLMATLKSGDLRGLLAQESRSTAGPCDSHCSCVNTHCSCHGNVTAAEPTELNFSLLSQRREAQLRELRSRLAASDSLTSSS